ncbi:MAG TPA: methyltransferase domain-containing protein [Acidimicrobiales bacterium]|jgi:SAM-dependent methyltransferase|nr:methyltransferase domain-containing protein [Acidimicrobiales bacterium]
MYTHDFYDLLAQQSGSSARAVVPHLIDLLHPSSVVDFGCGVGAWLAEFVNAGVTDVVGVDGPDVPGDRLQIPASSFVRHDLTRPFDLGRRFDVVLSLEVAEHLPADTAATFVDMLTRHADVAVFSAAVPGQGGTNHVNEQWPMYWLQHFSRAGWRPFDILRPRLWEDRRVGFWYRQNLLLFASAAGDARTGLSRHRGFDPQQPPSLVHPEQFQVKLDDLKVRPSLRAASRIFGRALSDAARRRLPRRSSGGTD